MLRGLSVDDTRQVYQAIRRAKPGGLGEVPQADVQDQRPPAISLTEAMHLAADRDLIARQYTNDFLQVFLAATYLERGLNEHRALGEVVVRAYLQLLAEFPDSLVARKCGPEVAGQVSLRAHAVLASGQDEQYRRCLEEFDFWLRADGHRRNPGTTADLVAAGLFVLLREQRLEWPVSFYDPAPELLPPVS